MQLQSTVKKLLWPRGHVRWMIRRDMATVLAIEAACFARPRTEDDFIGWLQKRNCIGMVIEVDEEVRGFMVYELHRHAMHLLDLAVAPDHWRRGLGTGMLDKLKSKLSVHRRTLLTIYVRESNLGGQLFLRAQGFRYTNVQSALYVGAEGGDAEDGYFFAHRLGNGQLTMDNG